MIVAVEKLNYYVHQYVSIVKASVVPMLKQITYDMNEETTDASFLFKTMYGNSTSKERRKRR